MHSEFLTQRRIEFSDTDMAGIVHFSNYFRFMEAVEHEFVRTLGLVLHFEREGRMHGFARVHAECDYKAPLRYAEVVDIHLRVLEKRASTISYEFRFRRRADGIEAARGMLTVCCVTRTPGEERLRASPLPAELDRLLCVAPAERDSGGSLEARSC